MQAVKARRSSALRELAEQQQERREVAEEAEIETVTDLAWESPLQIIRYPDPRLRARNARIGVFDERLARLSRELFEVMYNGDDGVGLAAPQVGVNVRVMVFNPTGRRGGEEVTLVNPRVLSVGRARELGEEGCLSFPQIFAPVERAYRVKVRAQDLTGQPLTLTLTDWRARIFQHEFDHLQGVLFHDRMAHAALESVREKLVALEEEYLRAHPGAPVQRVPQPS
ncbi:hypothetical protein WJX81_007904 [Elliptochloris bilobata]|uniref:Peptide deformylase n=1 Tax=Elliptochloris bilobata TaxID=381761 RepID=A0AAW1S9H9_9CHLO